ncbi:uncharacterized protein PRCAT00004379001 [Priceomyces carsonii]|uniref:uncharacterized protein n=1 Tax=Priceomyces carsonii TaxID=28549 RepID=UPI002ED7C71C|nr:unnamed protein product [Priceomyces carsonii]
MVLNFYVFDSTHIMSNSEASDSKALRYKGLSAVDKKTIELIELIDKYEKLMNDNVRKKFKDGFMNLSRANFNNSTFGRTFGIDNFDRRSHEACKHILNDNNKYSLIGSIKESNGNNITESTDTETEKLDVIQQEKVQNSLDTVDITSRNLRHRKNKVVRNTERTDKSHKKDPLYQFGGLVPHELKYAQEFFSDGLEDLISSLNVRIQIINLIDELNELKNNSEVI